MIRSSFILVLFFSLIKFVHAQEDFQWWVDKHHWDGITPWNQYMTISSAFMGPNALPVPEVRTGRADSIASINFSLDEFHGKGDNTQDVFLRGILPLFKNKISIEMEVVPLEWYKMDTITRDIRAVRTRSGQGSAGGDIYLTTCVQVIKDRTSLPDILLRYTIRTASGTHLRDARYTDAPGYYFDLSFGKNYSLNNFFNKIAWFADAGLYTYQTYDLQHLQDDCFFYGAGFMVMKNKLALTNEIASYSGYLRNGDRPVIYRAELKLVMPVFNYAISFQQGLHDYSYERFRLSCIINFLSMKIKGNK
jgi:hypothetical protein